MTQMTLNWVVLVTDEPTARVAYTRQNTVGLILTDTDFLVDIAKLVVIISYQGSGESH